MSNDQLSGSLAENILTLLCFDDTAAPIIVNSVDVGLFESDIYKEISKRAFEYYREFKTSPKDHLPDLLEDILGDKANPRKADLYQRTLINLHEFQNDINRDYVLSKLTGFVRQQRLKSAIVDATTYVREGNLDNAENVLSKALKSTIDIFHPGILLTDTKESLRFFDELTPAYMTGIRPLDQIKFGPAPGELLVILAPANRGKCVHENTEILLDNGALLTVKEIVENNLTNSVSIDTSTGKLVSSKIAKYYDNGIKSCFKVTTKSGRIVVVTPEHPFLTINAWKPITELSIGDYIGVARKLPNNGTKIVGKDIASYLAYMIAEGCLTASPHTFTNTQLDIQEHFKECIKNIGSSVARCTDNISVRINSKSGQNPARELIRQYNLDKCLSKHKRIPKEVFTWCKQDLKTFLNILFTCDGSIYFDNERPVIEYTCASEQLVDNLNHLLLRFGIVGKITRRNTKFRWAISQTEHVKLFINEIGFSSYKKDYANWALYKIELKHTSKRCRLDVTPKIVLESIRSELKKNDLTSIEKEVLQVYPSKRSRNLSNVIAHSIVNKHPEINFGCSISEYLLWDQIVKIEKTEPLQTYDLAVETYHNFIGNDVFLHNTWMMVHLGKFCAIQGLKVLHLSLEMSEEKMSQRYVQTFFAYGKRKADASYVKFNEDEMGRFTTMALSDIVRPTIQQSNEAESSKIYKELAKKLDRIHGRIKLWIKRFPTGALTVSGLEAYLDSMDRLYHYHPDVLLVDYADLMNLSSAHLRTETGNLYKDLRRIAVERNIAIVTASQANRLGEDAKVITLKHLAEDYSKAATADNIIAYCQTSQELRLGLARLFIAKARDEEREQTILISQCYRIGQFCMSAIGMQNRYWDELDVMSGTPTTEEEKETPKRLRKERVKLS